MRLVPSATRRPKVVQRRRVNSVGMRTSTTKLANMTSQSQTTVSVVIPAFNAEPWIGETLESVARQSYDVSTLEVLVVDDHSSDRTVDIATAVLKSGLPGGRIVRLPLNTGVSAARNIGWQQAKGEWIQFLDADDLISPEKLAEQSQFAALQTPDVAVVYSKWRHLKRIGDTWRPSGPIVEPELGPAPVVDMRRRHALGTSGQCS